VDLGLAGKMALVTAGSRGIGRAVVERLVAEGMRVAICARSAAGAAAAGAGTARRVVGMPWTPATIRARRLGRESAERLDGVVDGRTREGGWGSRTPEGWRRNFRST
jgi:NAD(P)-dependent dehydrogenase (short-subunit alcohol dehydrogenase family)